jgi:diguanylate cyclase (GGDEF)-like protein
MTNSVTGICVVLETELKRISIILNSLDALVYISDMQTYEMIFMNRYGEQHWGAWKGKRCWQVLQADQTGPCSFCTNHLLIDSAGKPTGVHIWEFQNTITGEWFECRDEAIEWIDGRLVRMEMAFNITARKALEAELKAAREHAEKLAQTDTLTGIKNRRAFFDNTTRLVKQACRYERPLTTVMIDIDNFKTINDTHGHFIGDEVIRQVATLISQNLREVDIFGRMGGEEFGLVFPETDFAEAQTLCERLRSLIEKLTIELNGHALKITCSFGMACKSSEKDSIESLLTLADKALYKAKNLGRNRVEFI